MQTHLPPSWARDNRVTMVLVLWTGIILLAGTMPFSNFVGHSHWEDIQWTVRPRDWRSLKFYFDVIANMTLFYPLGLLLARRFSARRTNSAFALVGAGLFVSICIELFQVFCHNRHPSVIDLVSDTTGTALGVATAQRVFSHWLLGAWFPPPHSHPTGS